MEKNKKQDENSRALKAASNKIDKNAFLTEESSHILYLTARILKRSISDKDDEYSIALMAVSEALDSYDEKKGAFWNYASLVIKSRILDEYRRKRGRDREILLAPEAFSGEKGEADNDAEIRIKNEINKKSAAYIDNSLKDELEELSRELKLYDIDLFELPKYSPKSEKTKKGCIELVSAFFLPPPLVDILKSTGKLPINELLKRYKASRKLIDRHRKFILASVLIKAGDYENIREYI